jgi:hypothetical protein
MESNPPAYVAWRYWDVVDIAYIGWWNQILQLLEIYSLTT